jgi:hypothetical protein
MDGFWMLNQALAAKTMILPTLVVNLLVFKFARQSFSQFAVVAAMNCWLAMNICWMVGDIDKDPKPVAVARWMFVLGLVFLGFGVGRDATQPDRLKTVLARFRRLRT